MYLVLEEVVQPADFIRLRKVSGLSPRPESVVAKGLARSLFGVTVWLGDQAVGMGRVVGDGALNFDIVDVAVDPPHQRRGLGRQIMAAIMGYIDREALPGAYVTLMADVPALYQPFGFELARPASEGMVYRVTSRQ